MATCQACAVCLRITRIQATLAALFGRVDVAFPPLLKQVFAGITPCARLIRSVLIAAGFETGSDPVRRLDLSPPMHPTPHI